MRALVTGAEGFVGGWLCRELLDGGWEVWGTKLDAHPASKAAHDWTKAVNWLVADVRRTEALSVALERSRPDAVFHLAAVAFVPAASADPSAALDVNVVATGRLLSVIRTMRGAGTLDPVVLIVGSGEQYGRHAESEMPLPETAEQRPLSVYAASKAAQEVVALEAFRSGGVRVIATRSFNHSGPGQSDNFLLPSLVRRSVALKATGQSALLLGNMTPVRDFLHVSDVARAYVMLVEHGSAGEVYNVASGVGTDVATLARRVLARVGGSAILSTDPSLVRPVDVPVLVGDSTKLRIACGWSARCSLDSIIDDLIRATPN